MSRWGVLWKRLCDKTSLELDGFFERLYSHSENENITSNINLVYREEQHNYALDIMNAIKNQAILLIQAGVGIGKSYGYLLPIFYTYNNDKRFNKIIISTSSIALQEQLLKDIDNVSKMLGINMTVAVAKGINNYACLAELYSYLHSADTDEEIKKVLKSLLRDMNAKSTSDKAELIRVSKDVWDLVRVKNRGRCSNCSYSKNCHYYKRQEDLNNYNFIVTNHGNLARNIIDKTDLLRDVDMVVFDEAHKLAENVQDVREGELQLDAIKSLIKDVSKDLNGYGVKALLIAIEKVFSGARASASKNFFVSSEERGAKGKYSVIDSKRLGFRITPTVKNWLEAVLEELEKLQQELNDYLLKIRNEIEQTNNKDKSKELSIKYHSINLKKEALKNIYKIFKDMKKANESCNIYWADFYDKNKITLKYIPKDNLDVLNSVFSIDIPIILTSATMGAYAGYKPIVDGLNLSEIDSRYRSLIIGEEQQSPYPYDEHTLFYYDSTMPVPSESDEYINKLVLKIDELIRITDGKALILFTSKRDMNRVYELLSKNYKYPFKLLLQTDNNTNEIREEFTHDTNACLFATGAFWEGIDIKGASLSNVIITRLPFEQLDAVNQYKASKYSNIEEQMREVYIPRMVMKFTQGVGRLIRSDDDTGIACCLDSRITKYRQDIEKAIPITNFTDDITRVKLFSNAYIIPRGTNISLQEVMALRSMYDDYVVESQENNDNSKTRG